MKEKCYILVLQPENTFIIIFDFLIFNLIFMENQSFMCEFGIIDTNCWQETNSNAKIVSFINTEQPQLIHIIETGWQEPQMYSVIIENGDLGYPDLEFLNEAQIKEKYNIKLKTKEK